MQAIAIPLRSSVMRFDCTFAFMCFRVVKLIIAARDIVDTYEAVGQWCLKFGQNFANTFFAPAKKSR
jgi:hypothetical protein